MLQEEPRKKSWDWPPLHSEFQQPVLRGSKGSSWLYVGYQLKELSFLSRNPGAVFSRVRAHCLLACPQNLTLGSDNLQVGLGVWDVKSPTSAKGVSVTEVRPLHCTELQTSEFRLDIALITSIDRNPGVLEFDTEKGMAC